MPTLRRLAPALLLPLALALVPAALAQPVDVAIANPSFEADPLAPGAFDTTITDWQTHPGFGQGVYRPVPSDYTDPIPDGVNVGYTNGLPARIFQVLDAVLEPHTRYVLQVEIGWNLNDPFTDYVVELQAGGVVLARDDHSFTPPQGTFETATVDYVSPAADGALGEPLEIHLYSRGVQANFDDVRLTAENVPVCAEQLLVPFFSTETDDPSGSNTLFAVRNLESGPVTADIAYFALDGTLQAEDSIEIGAHGATTVSLRDVAGLATDPDGVARGYVRILTVGNADGTPVLGGDFFQIDVGNDFATGDRLVRQGALCTDASIRFLDFGSATRLLIHLAEPRGDDADVDPPSFTVQVYDEAGNPDGAEQAVWTADRAVELSSADLTALSFGALRFDFTNSFGGTVYAEYSAEGRFSVGLSSQCAADGLCAEDGCCPPGAPTAVAAGLHYPTGTGITDCALAADDALRSLDSFHYRNACLQAHGGELPDEVLGARLVDCQVDPPGFGGGVVVAVEACCPAVP